MFSSLFNVKINWLAYFIIGILIYMIIPNISLLCFIALMIALHQFLLVFSSMNYIIPVRYLAGAFMCLQILVGAALAYSGLDQFQFNKYKMQISETDYFAYAIPLCICFIMGLHINSRLRGETIHVKSVKEYAQQNPKMAYIFIGGGFVASLVGPFAGAELGFIFYLLGSFKYIGAFLIILGERRVKWWIIALVFGSIVVSSLGQAMFHDLFTWAIFLCAVFAIKFKPSTLLKITATVTFVLAAVVVQQLKATYRSATVYQGKAGSVQDFEDVLQDANEQGSLFDTKTLAAQNVRINQGFIITYVMRYVPEKVPYSEGKELMQILEAAFLPRFLAPNKLKAGDNTIFTKYSGIVLSRSTSMSLGAPGDAYINFGVWGGSIFMFCFGYMFNFILIAFDRYGKTYPIATLFTPLVFYFPIRPDTALQTSMGHLVKACFLLYMILYIYKQRFEKRSLKPRPATVDAETVS